MARGADHGLCQPSYGIGKPVLITYCSRWAFCRQEGSSHTRSMVPLQPTRAAMPGCSLAIGIASVATPQLSNSSTASILALVMVRAARWSSRRMRLQTWHRVGGRPRRCGDVRNNLPEQTWWIDKPPAEAAQLDGEVSFHVTRPNEKLPIAHQPDIE